MTTKITEFEIGEQKYKLEFTKGNMHGHHCFSIHITKDLEQPLVVFYKSRLRKEGGLMLNVGNAHFYDITSVKEGKRIILNYLLNENI